MKGKENEVFCLCVCMRETIETRCLVEVCPVISRASRDCVKQEDYLFFFLFYKGYYTTDDVQ